MKGGGVLQRMCYFGGRVLRRKVVIQESRKASSTSVCSAFCAQDGPCVASNWRVFGLFPHCCQVHRPVFVHQRENYFSSCSAISRRSFRRLPRSGCFRADLRWNCLAPRNVGDSRNHQWSNQDWKETYPENAQKGSAECPLSGAMMCNVTLFIYICFWLCLLLEFVCCLPWEAASKPYSARGLRSSKAIILSISIWRGRRGTLVS